MEVRTHSTHQKASPTILKNQYFVHLQRENNTNLDNLKVGQQVYSE